MKPSTTLAIGTLVFIFSCKQNHEQSPHSFQPEVVAAHGYVVPKDSIAEHKEMITGNPKTVKAGKPKVILTNTNVRAAGTPKVVIAGTPKICIPGQDSFSIPRTLPVIDSPFMAGIPEIVTAREPYAKEQNSQNFSSFGRLQGLKSDDISCLLEDKNGNLWIGSGINGVSKYDGKNFTHFTVKEGLCNNYVTSMLEDKGGNIWIGTVVGLNRYDGKSFTHFTNKEGLSNDFVWSIIEDNSGNIWIGTNEGVNKYDGKSFTYFTHKEGLSNDAVWSMLKDKSGQLWFGTGDGICKYDGEKFTRYILKERVIPYGSHSILEDNSGNIWFSTGGSGVIIYDGKDFTRLTEKEGLSDQFVMCIRQDRRGNLWFGTSEGGVSKYDGKNFTWFSDKEGLSDNSVTCILEDKRGNLWFGTGKGVNKYGGKSFINYTIKEGLTNNYVRNILEDKKGNLWFGTNDGLNKYDRKSFRQFDNMGTILSMWEDKNGNFWFGSWGGVRKYDGKSFTFFTLDTDIYSITEDKSGQLWFGGFQGGVYRYDGKSFTHFTERQGLSNNFVLNMLTDKRGHLWFGTYGGGLTEFDGQNFIHFTEKEGLKENIIESMFEDKNGNLWIGFLNGGVSKYDGKNFTNFTDKEGLSNNNVISITEDRYGNIWFGTAFGLNKLKKDKLSSFDKDKADEAIGSLSDSGLLFKTYTYENGFSGGDVYGRKSIHEANDGTIWIGAGDRLTTFHPSEEILDTIAPNIELTGLTLFNENIAWQNLMSTHGKAGNNRNVNDTNIILGNGASFHDFHFDNVSKWYSVPENLSLPYDNNYLTFQFVGINTQSPKQVKYKYKLEGFDENWSTLTNRTEATFSNLPHGQYTFKVKAMNGDGYWSDEYHYSFTIRSPWWHTWWAYSLFTLSFFSITYALYRYRINKIHTKHEMVLQKHRTAELEMQALRSQMNPHFIFNSLNSINLFILENNKLHASEYLSKFSRLVRLILHNSEESFIVLERELEALRLYLELESLRFQDKFTYNIAVEDSIDTTFIRVPPLIIQPYAENAIWHGLIHKKEQGHLEIKLYQNDKLLYCKIADDGIGRNKAAQLKSKSASGKKSVGMRITANRLAILESNSDIKTNVMVKDVVLPDGEVGGTEVLLSIPIL